jgi:hypothetical protein
MGLIAIPLKLSMPFFLARSSPVAAFRATLWAWPMTFVALPLLSLLSRKLGPAVDRTAGAEVVLWIAIGITLFLSRVGCLGFGCVRSASALYTFPQSQGLNADLFIPRLVMLLTKEHTPHSAALGSTNAVVELIQMIGYMIGPPFVT